MDVKTLEEFVTICETLSFQETAERLNLSQSALTKHIHKLEEELGVSLFDRSTRSVQQNEYSQAYYPYAEQIVRTAKKGEAAMKSLSRSDESNLHLAFTSTCCRYGIIELISDFTKRYPQYNTQVTESAHVCDMVLGNQCDFAFANNGIQINEHLNKIIYRIDHLAIFMSPKDPLAQKSSLSIEDLNGKKMIAHCHPNGTYHLDTLDFQAACRNHGFEPRFTSTASYTSTILKLIQEEQGMAALYQGQVPADQMNPELTAVDLEPQIRSEIYLLSDPKRKKTKARKAFMNYLLEYGMTPENAL